MMRNILTPSGMQKFEFDDTMSAEEQESRMIESIAARAASVDSNGLGTMGAVGQFLAQAQQMIRPNNTPQRTGPRVIRASSAWGLTPEQVTNSFEAISQDAARQQEMDMRRQESLANRQMQLKQLQEQARLGAEELQTNILLKRMERQAREQEADEQFKNQKELEQMRQDDPTRGSAVKVNVMGPGGKPVMDASGNYVYEYINEGSVKGRTFVDDPMQRFVTELGPNGERRSAFTSPGGPPVNMPGGPNDVMAETPAVKRSQEIADMLYKHYEDSVTPEGVPLNGGELLGYVQAIEAGEVVPPPDVIPFNAWRMKQMGQDKEFEKRATMAKIARTRAQDAAAKVKSIGESMSTTSDPKLKEQSQKDLDMARLEFDKATEDFAKSWNALESVAPETPSDKPSGKTTSVAGYDINIIPSGDGATGKGSGEPEGEADRKSTPRIKSPSDVLPDITKRTSNFEVWDDRK